MGDRHAVTDSSHASADGVSGVILRQLSELHGVLKAVFNHGGMPKVHARRDRFCILCLDTVDSQDSYSCDCGANYHRGCFMTLHFCSRCRSSSSEESIALRESGWLPKFANFDDLSGDESFTSLHCRNCNAEVGAKDRYCGGCGYHLSTVTGFLCPVCTTEIKTENSFCSCCGATFGDEAVTLIQCPYCLRLIEAGDLECSCGMTLPPTCTRCGAPTDDELYCAGCNIRFELEPV
ncbi:MAG: zinc ribbon domain-containing protein [Thermoplasmata archaeon]|nr:zinc ribbon domain-containing protein [Candidatus Sysuiplasma jiujiangense]MBX8641258.1 zinc ribbon domain-containing protein [Candidatus Sysuiplasma jiujiangense]